MNSPPEHLAQLDAEIDNLHTALGWAVGQASAERALAMAAALSGYWLMRDRHADAMKWIDRALSLPGADIPPALRVRTLRSKVWYLWRLGRRAEQPAAMDDAEAIARQSGDPVILSQALQQRADRTAVAGRLDVADALADEALDWATTAGDDWAIALAAFGKAMAAPTIAELRGRVDRAASLLDKVGNGYQHANLLSSAAYVALGMDSDRDANEFVERAIPLTRELDSPYLWMMLYGNSGLAALLTGDSEAARHAFREELRLAGETVVYPFGAEGLLGLAAVATVRGNIRRAARLRGAAAAHESSRPDDAVDARLGAVFLEPARTRLGADAWDAAVRDGGKLTFEDAIAYALQEPGA